MFDNIHSKEEVKRLYKKLAMFLHPDHGGDHELMILLNESYQRALMFIDEVNKFDKEEEKKKAKETKSKFSKVYEDVFAFEVEKLKILDEMRAYAKEHKKFNSSYLESVLEYLEENKHITSNQYNALVNVYYSFRMDKSNDGND